MSDRIVDQNLTTLEKQELISQLCIRLMDWSDDVRDHGDKTVLKKGMVDLYSGCSDLVTQGSHLFSHLDRHPDARVDYWFKAVASFMLRKGRRDEDVRSERVLQDHREEEGDSDKGND